jgi:hypothetical protein
MTNDSRAALRSHKPKTWAIENTGMGIPQTGFFPGITKNPPVCKKILIKTKIYIFLSHPIYNYDI